MSDRVVVYARPLVRGQVKTRLAAGVGEARALDLYRAFFADVVGTARAVGVEVVVSVAGAPGDPGLEALAPGLRRVAQGAGDLGARMVETFVRGRDDGVRRLALVGSDHPAVQAADIRACLEAAEPGTVVLAPAADGGYWCVAADPATESGAGLRRGGVELGDGPRTDPPARRGRGTDGAPRAGGGRRGRGGGPRGPPGGARGPPGRGGARDPGGPGPGPGSLVGSPDGWRHIWGWRGSCAPRGSRSPWG